MSVSWVRWYSGDSVRKEWGLIELRPRGQAICLEGGLPKLFSFPPPPPPPEGSIPRRLEDREGVACADKAGYGAVRFGARRVAIYDTGFGAMLTRLGNDAGTIESYFVTIARHSHEVASGKGRCHHTESAVCNRLWDTFGPE